MINIILCCQQGASTSLLASNMKDSAEKKGIEVNIHAYPYAELKSIIDTADVVLFGPQVRYMVSQFKGLLEEKNKPYMVIDSVDYGMMDGKRVLEQALNEIKK